MYQIAYDNNGSVCFCLPEALDLAVSSLISVWGWRLSRTATSNATFILEFCFALDAFT